MNEEYSKLVKKILNRRHVCVFSKIARMSQMDHKTEF